MRIAATMTVLLGLSAAYGQQPPEINPAPRFNVLYNERFFPQTSPKATLTAVARAADLGQFDYLAAYLMDTPAADAEIAKRATAAASVAERDLRASRAIERRDPFRPAVENALPLDPKAFAERVVEVSTRRGFDTLVSELRERFQEDPSHLRELQRYLRDGDVAVTDATAKITLKAEKGKAINFKKIGTKWFIEDRFTDAPASMP
jgi:hypothetical protein